MFDIANYSPDSPGIPSGETEKSVVAEEHGGTARTFVRTVTNDAWVEIPREPRNRIACD